ncbi:MAG: 5-dehydro-4-deoxy-D-glucuronate isomerase [Candidatus Lumbricidophila eiseniae]|uniref:5-dehydro-4-deoxy-D-glucuronate isomerase n=1 Tax=Candidatus Lumbricidiphila eiseniae TaxID=1969409 RepID=A0A2A6FVI4_9MICO|nr:MAG: 5-dehydro-4-deoxy-D-glucuronate isomerase [Candidatus Lumbricidophila eiseniae]
MKPRHFPATHPDDVSRLTYRESRDRFVVTNLFIGGEIRFAHTEYERLFVGGLCPNGGTLSLPNLPDLDADYFLERREMGVVALTGSGTVVADGVDYAMRAHDVLYLGRGTQEVSFSGDAEYYTVSAAAHRAEPATLSRREDAESVEFGTTEGANRRTIRKHIHPGGVLSNHITLGVTTLHNGSVWNTMPPHIHERRTEIYMYFDLAGAIVQHTMGIPGDTRTISLGDKDVIISPPWSIHTGSGTGAYSFVWATAGENMTYNDNRPISPADLRS